MNKEKIITAINAMPEEFSLDDLFEKLVLIENIDKARIEIKQGKKIPLNEVKERINKWYK